MKPVLRTTGLLVAGVLVGGLAAGAFHAMTKSPRPAAGSPPLASAPLAASGPVAAPIPVSSGAPAAQSRAHASPSHPPAQVHRASQRAVVLGATPVTEAVKTTRTECRDVPVERQAPVTDEHRITGTVVGSAIGGVLGHQVGGGRGKNVATAVGALAGGLAGNQVQKNMQQKDTYTDTERRCMEVPAETTKVVGYDVRYSYEGHTDTVRMSHNPGSSLAMHNGRPIID
jgi:uncharacterized protein YcfJ